MKHWFSDLGAFRRDPLDFFLSRGVESDEPLRRLWLGPLPVYQVVDPDLIKPIMKADESIIDKGHLIYKLREVIGQSSMVLSGEKHRERRAVIHRMLARGLASSYVPDLSAMMRRYAVMLSAERSFDAHEATAPLALRVISTILFGPGTLSPGDENALVSSVKLVEDDLAASIFKFLPDLPWVRARKKERLRQGREIMEMVVDRARTRASEHSVLRGLEELDLTDKELGDEILLLFLAGHHTTGSAAAWLLYYLGTMPELTDAIADEAAAVSDESGEIDPQKLPKATVSMGVVREVLRLYPSAYWLSREVFETVELGGRKLRPGTSLLMSPWHLHRDPRNWENPTEFDHTRSHKHPSYMPFGVGPRACVGMGLGLLEMQLMALEFASAFNLSVISDVPAPEPKPSITIVPPKIEIALTPRQRRAEERRLVA